MSARPEDRSGLAVADLPDRDSAADSVHAVSARDVKVNSRRGGEMRVLLSPVTVNSTSGFMGTLRLAPGEHVSEHLHPYSEEFLYVVGGHGRIRLGGPSGEYVELGPDDALMVPTGMRHRLENTGTATLTAVFHLSPLAPRPDLGHVDTEPAPHQDDASVPDVGPAQDQGGAR
jgi:putative monooxygenase